MARGRSVFHLMALKQKVALARKTKAVNTLQEELNRTENVRDRLEEMAEGMTVPLGKTTVGHLRSASWYGNQVQEQLKTISNRAEFLSEEVASHRRDAARVRHQHNLAVEKGEAHDRQQRDLREEKAEAALPPRRSFKR
ncbi:MAG: hypothetical protein EBT94_06580 [Alphaproteobacteria bacterium]|jgi:hypothetical protein|nr:hypothetical protein [Alphaproteobacteria bacterium]